MSFENMNQFENGPRNHDELQLRNEIERGLLALKFSPDEEAAMADWMQKNGEKLSNALSLLEQEHGDLGFLWEESPSGVLDALQEKMNEADQNDTRDDMPMAA